MKSSTLINPSPIKEKIFTIRNVQVMLDEDLAILYGAPTGVLNQAMRRNIDRFPEEFCFKLTQCEFTHLRSQFATSNVENDSNILTVRTNLKSQFVISSLHGGRRSLPYVFTEQGVAMLSAVLKSEIAVKVSISIMNAFISMRKIIADNNQIIARLDTVEQKQIVTDQKVEQVLNALSGQDQITPQKLFFDNKVFDAYEFVAKIIRSANHKIILIDNFIDETVLSLFTKRKEKVQVTLYTKKITHTLKLDLEKFNAQYPPIEVKEFDKSHDRFLIIDNADTYHFGASLKDLGKKWFVVTKIDIKALQLLGKL